MSSSPNGPLQIGPLISAPPPPIAPLSVAPPPVARSSIAPSSIAPSSPMPRNAVPVPAGEVYAIASEYVEAGRLDAAERMLGHILAAAPNQSDALHLKGLIAFRRGKMAEAAGLMERSLAAGAPKSAHFRNLSEVYRLLARLDEALAAARRAVSLDPADPLGPFNLAMVHYDRQEIAACIAAARHSLALRPNLPQSHMKLAQALLIDESFAEGWAEYEWRYQIPGAQPLMPKTDKPQWDGAPAPDDTIMLIADQGFGDVVMFSRYIPWVQARCRDVAVACSSEMLPILGRVFPGIKLFNRWDEAPPYKAYCALSGLPRLHGTDLSNIPVTEPYLPAEPERVEIWRRRLDTMVPVGLKRVGIAWAGRPTHNNDINRSITLAMLAPIAAVEGIALVSIQKGPAVSQIADYTGRAPLIDLDKQIVDFDDTLALMQSLDLLITVDTAVGHFAGASGRPAWVMLPFAPDWRWLQKRPDTPWYPSLRFFRHPAPRSWAQVIPAVAEALRGFVAAG